ncbi:hypothetical protein PRZ48_012330 [Zasmidium cellare]|uniref:Mitochondrial resolvase Ydc2 catalytic domain-containing protein n=1 Tax=Zasmidium cellare TaxID=395010 RepID=A0ABR0E4Q7_ZASCE|nr:hypothetical protein PRZ48_012330 [Zasmidium cellare]
MSALRASTIPVKAWQLKYWAFLTGMPTTGTKAELLARLTTPLDDHVPAKKPTKIVSVDMGIRNLAYCAIETPGQDFSLKDKPPSPATSNLNNEEKEALRQHDPRFGESPEITGLKKKRQTQAIQVSTWKRMDLTKKDPARDSTTEQDIEEPSPEADLPPSDAFTPSRLSRTALKVTEEILSLNPTTILIERQRFRSGGGAAIQEWTVRVNMLESMIWACLETLRARSSTPTSFPTVHAVSPAQVLNFWASPASSSLLPPTLFHEENSSIQNMVTNYMSTRMKLSKKDKIGIARRWCRYDTDVQLKFNEESWRIAGVLVTSDRQTKAIKEQVGGKLDDLADCLLQGVTWVQWERNRQILSEMWKEAVEEAVEEADRAKAE